MTGRDALATWKTYFERVRGYPKKGEPATLDQHGKGLTKLAFFHAHRRAVLELNYIPLNNVKSAARSGMSLHELRDLARSMFEKAKVDGFNTNSAEFWMGHTVDELFYNKIGSLDPEYNLQQYRVAEEYLNIVSGSVVMDRRQVADELLKDEAFLMQIQEIIARDSGAKLVPTESGDEPLSPFRHFCEPRPPREDARPEFAGF